MTQNSSPKRDATREDQMLLIKRIAIIAAIILGLLLWYDATKPEKGNPYASCWTFIIGMDTSCQADLASNHMVGNGYTHSKEWLEANK